MVGNNTLSTPDLFNLLVYMRLLKKILMHGPLRIEMEGTKKVMSVFENKI